MENSRSHSVILLFYIHSLLLYSFLLVLGSVGQLHAFNITENTISASKLLCLIQFVLAFVHCHLFSNEEKSKGWKKKASKLLSQSGLLLLCIITFHVVAILYGAPAFESVSETFNFACLLAVFSMHSSILLYGNSWSQWFVTLSTLGSGNDVTAKNVAVTCLSTIIGAWIGAFPIPLDWDRPWQVWPRSCMYGILIGHCCGLLLCLLLTSFKIGETHRSQHRGKSKRV